MLTPLRFLSFSLLTAMLFACGSPDLAFVNEVKSFETSWTDLNDKLTTLDRNRRLSLAHYEESMKALTENAAIEDGVSADLKNEVSQSLESIIKEHQDLAVRIEVQKEQYTGTLISFNEWQQDLVSAKTGGEEARLAFDEYKSMQQSLSQELDSLQQSLMDNINSYNKLSGDISSKLGIISSRFVPTR